MGKKKKIMIGSVAGILLLVTLVIGASYAYYTATVSGSGNTHDNTSSIITAELPSLVYNNGENFSGDGAYPGYKNIHTFTLKPQASSKGTAVYVIHLNAVVATEFGNDIKVTLYKTTDSIINNVIRTEGVVTPIMGSNGNYQYSKIDTISTTGTLEKVYEKTLLTNSDILLEEKEFNETMQETKYFLVYEYLNQELSQDSAQNKSFSGKVTVSLQREKSPLKPLNGFGIHEIVTTLGNGIYEVKHDEAIIEAPLSELEKTNLKQTEYRYAGSNPNNYVTFNNELWRIIGLVNTPEGQKIKLIRSEMISSYSWDSNTNSVNSGYGVNEWSQADIMKLLNPGYDSESIGGSLYYNSQKGNCYSGRNNANKACDFTSNGLSESAKNMISDTVWNIGSNGTNNYQITATGLSKHFYNYERSNNGKICTSGIYCDDSVTRTTTLNGYVGLMTPSDYGYATSGGSATNRETCLNKEMYSWNSSSISDCKTNDWLYSSTYQWTMTPRAGASDAYSVFRVDSSGYVLSDCANYAYNVRPSIYLNSNIKVTSGLGTSNNPYQLT